MLVDDLLPSSPHFAKMLTILIYDVEFADMLVEAAKLIESIINEKNYKTFF